MPNLGRLALLVVLAFGCTGATSRVRRAATAGDVTNALRLYHDYTDERGEGDPDLLADIALATLRNAAASGDPRTRAAGFSTLRSLGVRARDTLEELARREGVVGDRAAAALFELDGRTGRAPVRLRAARASDDPERRVVGIVALRGRGGVRRLAAMSRDPDTTVRAAVARELARHRRDAEATRALVTMAREDAEATVRSAALQALGAHGEPAVETLVASLQDRDAIVRMAVPGALMAASQDRAAEVLTPLLSDELTAFSLEVARVLSTRSVAVAREYILGALAQRERPALRPQAAVAANTLDDASVGALVQWLRDDDVEVSFRVAAILLRKESYRQAALAVLRPVAARPDAFVAVRALSVLATVQEPSAVEPIRQAMTSSDASVRRVAVLAWAQVIGQGSDCDPLVARLQDEDLSVSLLAAMQIVLIAGRT